MANEAEIINNPDSTPGAVSTGYQLQNTNMVAARVGEDKTVVEGGTGECKLLISGPVDVDGTQYTINSDVTFTLTTAGAYYIHLSGTGDNLTPTIGLATTYPHTFDADKNARYTDTGSYRVLNWIVYYDGTTARAHRIITPENTKIKIEDLDTFEETWITGNGNWTAPRSKYYTIWMTGKGGNAIASGSNKGSGGASGTGQKRIWIDAGDIWTATFSTSEGGNLSFTNGITTLTIANASNKIGGSSSSGIDNFMPGGSGSGDNQTSPMTYYSYGANSFYGGAGSWIISSLGAPIGGGATGYGSGGGYAAGNCGTGKSGVIRIIG